MIPRRFGYTRINGLNRGIFCELRRTQPIFSPADGSDEIVDPALNHVGADPAGIIILTSFMSHVYRERKKKRFLHARMYLENIIT